MQKISPVKKNTNATEKGILQKKQITIKICTVPMSQFTDFQTTYVAFCKIIISRNWI